MSRARFGVFEADLRSGELRKRGSRLRLQQQPFRVLEMLLERPGEVVLRDEIRQRLWPGDTWVDFDHGVNKAVNKLRETLGDSAENPRFIETLPKRGYRFVAPVEFVANAPVVALQAPVETSGSERTELTAFAKASAFARRASADRTAVKNLRTTTAVALLAVGILAIGSYWAWTRLKTAPASAQRTMLAVLPFANLDADASQDYFCDGMTDEMILQLGRLNPERLGVIARTSSMHYKNTTKRVDEIGAELGVAYLIEGSVRRRDQTVRINARLVRREDQTPLWSESYERGVADVFEIQRDVAERIASALAPELLAGAGIASPAVPKATAAAYEAYLRGRYHWNRRTPPDLEAAVTWLEQAVSLDPQYVPAQAALADALNVLPWYGLRPPGEAYPRSKAVATRALALDPSSAAAHTALAYAHHYYDWNWVDAEREYHRALALNPNYAQAHQWLAAHYAETGRTDEALSEIELARRLDPRSLIINAAIGWINYLGRRYDPAIEQLRRTLESDGDFVPARLWLGQALEAAGRPGEAIEHYLHARRVAGTAPTGLAELARGYAAAARVEEARRTLDELLALGRTRYIEPDLIARVYAGLGDRERAIASLERGLRERAVKMVLIGFDAQFDALRDDPRFRAIVDRLALPKAQSPKPKA